MARPTIMTPEVVNKLEVAFALGCTDVEACLYADISRMTLQNYQTANPEFIDRKEQLKETPILLARTSVVNKLSTDADLALRYLERKNKAEFGMKQSIDVDVTSKGESIAAVSRLSELAAKIADVPKA